jgi:ABC-type Fe3+-hydroxamate transport system substrate-binding protein
VSRSWVSIYAVSTNVEKRWVPDRRVRSRGGRRPSDRRGATPLVVVADDEPGSRTTCETILAKLNFAVAPVESLPKALEVMAALRPEVVVAKVRGDASLLKQQSLAPVVVVTEEMSDPDILVEAIRQALRRRRL